MQVRPAFGGNLMAVIHQPVARPQLATLRPHITKPAKARTKTTPVIEHASMVGLPRSFDKKVLKTVREVAEESGNLDEAEVVIGIGRGLGSLENIKTINRLAVLLKAAVGGSRGVVDGDGCLIVSRLVLQDELSLPRCTWPLAFQERYST